MNRIYRGTPRGQQSEGGAPAVDTRQRPRAGSLRRALAWYALISIVLPLGLTGGAVLFLLTYHLDIIESSFERSRESLTRDIAGTDIRDRASNTARQIDTFLIERIVEAKAWASARIVVQAARAAHRRHVEAGLVGRSIASIEARFSDRKSLGFFPEADTYLLQRVRASPHFAEIFFTDRSGFNVALTNPTSDFVQSDEDWWQIAWSEQLAVGQVEYDNSASAWSIDILVRIDEPGTGQPVGVMKAVLAIAPVQQIANQIARTIPNGRLLVATKNGSLVADTSSDHSRDRIMSPSFNLLEDVTEESARAATLSSENAGFVADKEWITGFSHSGGRTVYGAVTKRFSGFNWIILLQRPVSTVLDPLGALRALQTALQDSRLFFTFGLGIIGLVVAFFAFLHTVFIARRLRASLRAVGDMAERAARGEQVAPAAIEHPEEIVQLNEAVHHLCQVFMAVLRRGQPRPPTQP